MRPAFLTGLAMLAVTNVAWSQEKEAPEDRQGKAAPETLQEREAPESRIVFGPKNEYLARGADAMRAGSYDEGILLTRQGLDRPGNTALERAAGLSNLCAGYAAKELPDLAISLCTEALALNDRTWQAYSNRSYAYWLKGMYAQAEDDLEAAEALSPRARQIAQIRGMINEAGLRPHVTVEDLQ
jgi:tetratricopeptide (TPR) repeat protein